MIVASAALASILFAQSRMADPSTWWSAEDYPADAVAEGDAGSVTASFDISRQGRAVNCLVERADHPQLGAATCALIEQRARYVPAYNRQGRPITARDRITAEWRLEGGEPAVGFETDYGGAMPIRSPREWVVPADLPTEEIDRTSPGRVAVAFEIGIDGRVGGCRASEPSRSAIIDGRVCELIAERARFRTPLDQSGNRVPVQGRTTIRWCATAGRTC